MLVEIIVSFMITEVIAGYIARRAYVLGRRGVAHQIVCAMLTAPTAYLFIVLLIGSVPMNR